MTTVIRRFATDGIDYDILALKSVSRAFKVQKQSARELKEMRELHDVQYRMQMEANEQRRNIDAALRIAMMGRNG